MKNNAAVQKKRGKNNLFSMEMGTWNESVKPGLIPSSMDLMSSAKDCRFSMDGRSARRLSVLSERTSFYSYKVNK